METLVSVEAKVAGERLARLHLGSGADAPKDVGAFLAAAYADEDDLNRLPLQEALVNAPSLEVVAYPTIGSPDVLQVFLRNGPGDDGFVFAFVLVTRARLRTMMLENGYVVEGLALQVAPSEGLSVESVRTAVQGWVERNFPTKVLPAITLELWTGPDEEYFKRIEAEKEMEKYRRQQYENLKKEFENK